MKIAPIRIITILLLCLLSSEVYSDDYQDISEADIRRTLILLYLKKMENSDNVRELLAIKRMSNSIEANVELGTDGISYIEAAERHRQRWRDSVLFIESTNDNAFLVEVAKDIPKGGETASAILRRTFDWLDSEEIEDAKKVIASQGNKAYKNETQIVLDFVNDFESASDAGKQEICRSTRNLWRVDICGDKNQLLEKLRGSGGDFESKIQITRLNKKIEHNKLILDANNEEMKRLREEALSTKKEVEKVNRKLSENTRRNLEDKKAEEIRRLGEFKKVSEGVGELGRQFSNFEAGSIFRDEQIIQGVKNNGKKLDLLITYEKAKLKNEHERVKKEVEQKAIYDDLQATGKLFSQIIGAVDPDAGKKTYAVINSAFKINKSVRKFLSVLDKTNYSGIGTAALTGDVVNVVVSLINAFSEDQPTADELILEQLAEIRKDIAEVQKHLVEIDSKLDVIYQGVLNNFDLVNSNIEGININVLRNYNLLLDNQDIILNANEWIINRINSAEKGVCLLMIENRQIMSDEIYRDCVYHFKNNISEYIYENEIKSLSFNNDVATIRNKLFNRTFERSTFVLRELFKKRHGGIFDAKIASYDQWLVAYNYLLAFIIYSPGQAKKAFLNGDFGADEIIDNAESIKKFKFEALSSLLGFNRSDLTGEYTWLESSPALHNMNRLSKDLSDKIEELIDESINEYNNKHGFNIIRDETYGIQHEWGDRSGCQYFGLRTYNNPIFGNINIYDKLTNKHKKPNESSVIDYSYWSENDGDGGGIGMFSLPHRKKEIHITMNNDSICNMLMSGLGIFDVELIFEGDDGQDDIGPSSRYNCRRGGLISGNTYYTIQSSTSRMRAFCEKDIWSLRLSLKDIPGNWEKPITVRSNCSQDCTECENIEMKKINKVIKDYKFTINKKGNQNRRCNTKVPYQDSLSVGGGSSPGESSYGKPFRCSSNKCLSDGLFTRYDAKGLDIKMDLFQDYVPHLWSFDDGSDSQLGPHISRNGWVLSRIYNYHRKKIARLIYNNLQDNNSLIAKDIRRIENNLEKESIYIAALVKFAFSDVIHLSQSLNFVGSSEFRYPKITETLNEMSDLNDIYKLPKYMASHASKYDKYFQLKTIKNLGKQALTFEYINMDIEVINQFRDILIE